VQYHIRRGQIARDAGRGLTAVPIYEHLKWVPARPTLAVQSPSRSNPGRIQTAPSPAHRRRKRKLAGVPGPNCAASGNHVGKALVYGGEVCFNAGFPFVSPVMRRDTPLKYSSRKPRF